MRNNKEGLTKKAKEYSIKALKRMDNFYKKHCLNNSDPLSIILKTHLYIESCLNEIFKMNLPCPRHILEKSFSQKLDIFEALNLGCPPANGLVEKKLRLINKIRNSFAHNLNKSLSTTEIGQLTEGFKNCSYSNSPRELKTIMVYIISYLHGVMAFHHFFPFLNSYLRNEKVFEKDAFFARNILQSYSYDKAKEIMKALKID